MELADPLPRQRELRFAVGDPTGLSSNSWRVWTKQDGDVYICCRDNYGEFKVSLHGDRWRCGFSAQGAAATAHLRPGGEDRAWDKWERPASASGVTIGYRLAFVASELAMGPAARRKNNWDKVEFLGGPPAGGLTLVTVTINEPNVEWEVSGGTARFLDLPGDGRVQVGIQSGPLTPHFRRDLQISYRRALQISSGISDEMKAYPTARILLTGEDPSGAHFATEVFYHRPHPDPLELVA